jgi:hypothetical protein
MQQTVGNIWDWLNERAEIIIWLNERAEIIWLNERAEIIIPTNQGWRADGTNVMGAGLAKQAVDRYPGIDQWYGAWCRDHRDESCVVRHPVAPLIFFPTKPLNPEAPHLSWQSPATVETVTRSLRDLARLPPLAGWPGGGLIALPLVGCGLGGLPEATVLPLLHEWLTSDRFVLVQQR